MVTLSRLHVSVLTSNPVHLCKTLDSIWSPKCYLQDEARMKNGVKESIIEALSKNGGGVGTTR